MTNAANVDGSEPIEFFGSDYADEPSALAYSETGGSMYRAQYEYRESQPERAR